MTTRLVRYNQRNLPLSQQVGSVSIPDTVIASDTTTLSFAGYDSYGYEKSLQESLLWLQENFAGIVPPEKAIKGQLWYNTTDKIIYVYDGDDFSEGGDSTNLINWISANDIHYSDLNDHLTNFNNPHNVTKVQVGLGNVANALQLIASNNLSDIPNSLTARTNLDVYSKSEINSSFALKTDVTTEIGTALNTTALFLKSGSNNIYAHRLLLSNNNPIEFTADAASVSTPIKMRDGDVLFTVSDNNRNFNIKAGVTAGTEQHLHSGDGATLIGMNYKGVNGSIVLGAAATGTQNLSVNFQSFLEIKPENLLWNGYEVATILGFGMVGDIVAEAPLLNIGSSGTPFEYTYTNNLESDQIVVNKITHNNAVVSNTYFTTNNPNIPFLRTDTKNIEYVTFATLKDEIVGEIGTSTTSTAGIAKMAAVSDVIRSTTDETKIINPKTLVNSAPTCKAWVSFFGVNVINVKSKYNVSSVVRDAKGIYTINFETPMPNADYCVCFGNTAGKAGTQGAIYSNSGGNDDDIDKAWEAPPLNMTTNSLTVCFGNGSSLRDVYNASITIFSY